MKLIHRMLIPLLRRLGQHELLYGSRQRALLLFTRIAQWSDKPEHQFHLALTYMNLRDYARAASILAPIYENVPQQLFAGLTYAQCLLLSKRWNEAAAVYERLMALHPENKLLSLLHTMCSDAVARDRYATSLDYQFQASLLQEQRKYQEALDILNKAVELSPDDAALYNNLGALLLKTGGSKAEIMAAFSTAMQLAPDNDTYKRNYRRVWQSIKK